MGINNYERMKIQILGGKDVKKLEIQRIEKITFVDMKITNNYNKSRDGQGDSKLGMKSSQNEVGERTDSRVCR